MSVFNILFDILGPVALLVAIGAVAGPRLGVDVGSLSRLAYWVFGPAFAFGLLVDADIAIGTVVRLSGAAVAGMVAALLVSVVWTRVAGFGYEISAATAITSVHGNVGNAGLAVVAFALGDDALPIAGVLMLIINPIGLSLGVGLARARTSSPLAAAWQGATAPMTVAGLVAVLMNVVDVRMPVLIDRAVVILAGAMIPLMLFSLGMQLVASGRPRWSNDLAAVLVAKLAVAPLVAGLVGAALGLSGDFLAATVIQSAMPPAVFCAVVAIENDLVPDRVTAAVVLATLMSLLTLPVVLLLI